MTILRKAIPAVEGISRAMFWIAGLALTAMMVLTAADVLLRAFRTPILGTYELVGLLGAVAVGFSIPQTTIQKGHVKMDFVTDKAGRRGKILLGALTRLGGVVLFLILAYTLWGLGDDLRASGEVSLTLQIPQYPVAYGVACCCLVQCLVLITGAGADDEESN